MNKNELRILYKNKRASLTEALCDVYSIDIANNALKLPIWDKNVYHIFLPIEKNKEVNTEYILDILYGKDKDVVVPKSDFSDNSMVSYLLTEQTKISINKFGIPEPVSGIKVNSMDIDVLFIPLLAFDNKGNRVGYGKGFYDKFLKSCRQDVVKVGLSFFEGENFIEDVFEGDIPLDYCVTPKNNYKF